MLSHYLLVAVRNLRRHKVFSIVNILGLATAMLAGLIIFIYVHFETHYEAFWRDSGRIHRVVHDRFQNGELSLRSAKAFWGMEQALKEKLPELAGATEIFHDVVSVSHQQNRIQDIPMFGANESFGEVFPLIYLGKKSDNPLLDLHSAVLSESATKKLFGDANPIGKWFKVNEGWEFECTGVFKDLPANTHLSFDLLLTRKTYLWYFANKNRTSNRADTKDTAAYRANKQVTSWDWGYNGCYIYLLLRPGVDPLQLEAKINQIKGDYLAKLTKDGTKMEFFLQPIRDIHLHSHRTLETRANGDAKSVLATGILGVVILAIAWINFVNLTLARSLERAKEVGIRKVAGASRGQLIAQHFIEYGLMNLLAAALAVLLLVLLQPVVLQLLERKVDLLALFRQPDFLLGCAGVLAGGVLFSGFYPAFVQSSYTTTMLFKPKHKISARHFNPRKLLVVGQFTASIILLIGVITIYRQIDFMRRQALGVNIERTLVTYSSMTDIGSPKRIPSLETFKAQVRALPGVAGMATASVLPGKEITWQRQDIRKASDLPNTKKNYAYAYIDHDFIPTFGLGLKAGRNFSDKTAGEATSVIVNEAAVKQLGYPEPRAAVDQFIWIGDKQFQIVGVVNDYHQESLRKEIPPIVYYCGYKWIYDVGYYAIKFNSADVRATVEAIRKIWEKIYPLDNFEYRFLDEAFDQQYQGDRRFGTLFTLFTLLAVFVACLGLQGLATYAIERRTKEIGIRKVNGATAGQIVVMLTAEFAALVAIAFVIACPIAYQVMNSWLQNYAYRTNLGWVVFLAAGVLALAIAIGTTLFQAYRAATRNPIVALRYE